MWPIYLTIGGAFRSEYELVGNASAKPITKRRDQKNPAQYL